MIVYADADPLRKPVPPPWLVGARDLCQRESADGRLWAIGDPLLLGPHPEAHWWDLGDKWRCAILPGLDGRDLTCAQAWANVYPVRGLNGIVWMAPAILTPMGEPAYRPTLGGPNWLPMPTPEQTECHEVASAARAALTCATTGGAEVPLAAACRWAAVLLAAVNHTSPEVFACGLMDEPLALQVCAIGGGFGPAD